MIGAFILSIYVLSILATVLFFVSKMFIASIVSIIMVTVLAILINSYFE
jgi:hypothetical protein